MSSTVKRIGGAVVGWLGKPWRLGLSRAHCLALLALFCSCAYVYSTQDLRKYNTANVEAHGDGRYYYVYLRSLALDGDIDFANDYRLLGNPYGFGKSKKTGRYANVFTIGPALYWAPFLGAAHGGLAVGNALGWSHDSLDGTSQTYQRTIFFGSLFWAFGSVILFVLAGRRFSSPRVAGLAGWSTLLATPLLWFALRQPSFSHAVSAFAVGAFVLYWLATQGSGRTRRQWAVLGGLLGLAILVRPQNAGHGLLALVEWVSSAVVCLHGRDWRALSKLVWRGLLFVAGIFVAFLPQLVSWWIIYGSPFTIPQGKSFMHWTNSRWEAVLFSSRAGLFAWHPLIYLAIGGLLLLAIRHRADRWASREGGLDSRLIGVAMLGAFVTQVYLNGAAWDWYGGWAFGGRRFLSCSVYFAVGLAVALQGLVTVLSRVKRTLVAAMPIAVCVLFVVLNLGLMDGYLRNKVRHGAAQEMGPVWERIVGSTFRSVYERIGNLGSAPANWVFAVRAGAKPSDYDLISGRQVLDRSDRDTLSFAGPGLAYRGFAEAPRQVAGKRARLLLRKRGTFVLGLRDRKGMAAALTIASTSSSSRVRIALQGTTLLDARLSPKWSTHLFFIPRILTRTGLNYFSIEQTTDPRGPLAIGNTGKLTAAELSIESSSFAVGRRVVGTLGLTRLETKRRGVVLFVADDEVSALRLAGVFDTFGRDDAVKGLEQALQRLKPGTVVMLGVVDEASRKWSKLGDRALRLVGGKVSLVKRYRCSYALIGVRGAVPGSALEKLDCSRRVSLHVGRRYGQRHTGVAFSSLQLRALKNP
jgi:hypothetical protein